MLMLNNKEDLNSYEKQLILHLTPKQFVKLDKLHKKMKQNKKSLSTITQDVLENRISEDRLVNFKETAFCCHANITPRKMLVQKSENITDSYLDLLQNLNNETLTLRYNGDIASLALEAGNLSNEDLQLKFAKFEENSNSNSLSSTSIQSTF